MTIGTAGQPRLAARVTGWLAAQKKAYAIEADDDRPLTGYLTAIGVFSTITLAAGTISARKRRDPMTFGEVLLVGAATHKLARVVAKDAVASPIRAPFTRYTGPGGPGEVTEELRGTGLRHSTGELLTCPFCLSPWIATGLITGRSVAPGLTRHVTYVFTAAAISDLLQFGRTALEQTTE
jgi:hypothetical protein